jgi:pimeloyl-ACP methyl ester carboxylesterase
MPYFNHNDHRLFYREQGAGPLLVVLPGNTASSALHAGELAYFGQRYHTVVLDFWGTGQSDRLAEWPVSWFEQAAHDAAALIRHLDGDPAIVMGTSGGAATALALAQRYPDHVRAVVADSGVPQSSPEQLTATCEGRAVRMPAQIQFWQAAHGDDWEQVVDADTAMLMRVAERGGELVSVVLNEIPVPVLLTATLDDDLLPNVGEQLLAMAERIPDSYLCLGRGGGHPLMWSRPDVFRSEVDCFLARL